MLLASSWRRIVTVTAALLQTAKAVTNFTGDVLNGIPVISYLDLNDVPPAAMTRYYLYGSELNAGVIPLHIPIFVARGPADTFESGKKLSISAAVHGDELNGVRVVQRVFEELETKAASLNGTVIGIPTINLPGIYLNQRNFFTSSSSGFLTNVNRIFPGEDPLEGASAPDSLAYNIWNHVWGNTSNVDVALDLHTMSTGSDAPLWCYADVRLPYVERLAKLLEPDILKIDEGEPGSIETTFVDAEIPAITVEIGAAKQWRTDYQDRVVTFIERLLDDLRIAPSDSGPYEPDLSDTWTAMVYHNLPALHGGFAETLVKVLDDVVEGQEVAIIRNAWGDVLEVVKSPKAGKMLRVATDPATEPGRSVAAVTYNTTDPDCAAGCII
ncbi:hypothetical protein BDY21DRAFT_388662 [Lineolata rhizophorae]|uniref:Succinylglutamate desuccinylase/Aspartoacylase catalytic domain-containing protein n=1 Tax=Lineolata rhizophorae TaxID=578093 RepID=A0A6A6NL42_9PEZI|nr:hypothetical protein BDY21DRAFT_388662 [Lineolata rhizophorae]